MLNNLLMFWENRSFKRLFSRIHYYKWFQWFVLCLWNRKLKYTRGAKIIGLTAVFVYLHMFVFVCVCSTLRQRADPVYSPPLQISGLCWRLKVYPVSLLYWCVLGYAIEGKLIILHCFLGWEWGGPWKLPVCLPGIVCWSPWNIKV